MSKQKIDLTRLVFNKQKFQNTVDTEFTQLVEVPDETFFDINLANIEDFFTLYQNLFKSKILISFVLHKNFQFPSEINNGAYTLPKNIGYSATIKEAAVKTYKFPNGTYWK